MQDRDGLDNFQLVGIHPCSDRGPQVNVTFNIDANAIVNVSAHDKETRKQQQNLIQWALKGQS